MNLRKTNLYTEITMTKNEFVKAFYMKDQVQIHLVDPDKTDKYIYVKRVDRSNDNTTHYMANIVSIVNGEGSIMIKNSETPVEDGSQLVEIGFRTQIIHLIMIAKYMVEKEGYEVK